jgi:ketosteroid isomerase-like protein
LTLDEAAIRTLLEMHANAIRLKDAEQALAPYAPGSVLYDLAPPLAYRSDAAEDRAGIEAWFATWDGPIGYELREFEVSSSGPLATAHGFLRISGIRKEGVEEEDGPVSVWTRRTVVLCRREGGWRITHDHISTPFYMGRSARAATDLEPQTAASQA